VKLAVGVVATLTSSQPSFPTSFKKSSSSKILSESSTLNSLIMYSHVIRSSIVPGRFGSHVYNSAVVLGEPGGIRKMPAESFYIRFYQYEVLTRI